MDADVTAPRRMAHGSGPAGVTTCAGLSAAPAAVPASHRDLLDRPPVATLTTIMPDGTPQTTPVWCDVEGADVLVNVMRGFRKERNMRRNPRVTLLCFDPRRPRRALEIRGRVVEQTERGAPAHLDALARRYTGKAPYFGACIPASCRATETPVLCRIRPTRVVALDATRPDAPDPPGRSGGDDTPAAETTPATPAIPASHRDLLTRPVHGVLATLMPDGQPQATLVWVDYEGGCACVNTTRERQKGRNLRANPKVGLLVVDPEDTGRYLQIRGEAELSEAGALAHLDRLTRKYTRHPRFYGHVAPLAQRRRETRVICRIRPHAITVDAVHR